MSKPKMTPIKNKPTPKGGYKTQPREKPKDIAKTTKPTRAKNGLGRALQSENRTNLPMAQAADAYLWGFMDPIAAARGPGDANYQTYVVCHESFTDTSIIPTAVVFNADSGINRSLFNTIGSVATAVPQINGAGNSLYANPANHQLPFGMDTATIVACPHYVRTIAGQPASNNIAPAPNPLGYSVATGMQSGFIVSGKLRYGSNMYCNKEGEGPIISDDGLTMTPLNLFDIEPLQEKFPVKGYQNATSSNNVMAYRMVRHRTVGLKITVEINSPALTVSGQVVGGNNNLIYANQTEQETVLRPMAGSSSTYGEDSVIEMLAESAFDTDEGPFTGKTLSNQRRDLGAMSHGQVYEACFLPTSDRILQWNVNAGRYSALNTVTAGNTSVSDCVNKFKDTVDTCFISTFGSFVDNIPIAYITMSGIPGGGVQIRTKIAWAVEYVVENQGPLALVRQAARLNSRFMVDWGMLSRCCGAGKQFECCTSGMMCCKPLFRGFLHAAGAIPRQPMSRANPDMYALGPTSSTKLIAARSGIGSVIDDIGPNDSASQVGSRVSSASRVSEVVSKVSNAVSKIAGFASNIPGPVGTVASVVSSGARWIGSLFD